MDFPQLSQDSPLNTPIDIRRIQPPWKQDSFSRTPSSKKPQVFATPGFTPNLLKSLTQTPDPLATPLPLTPRAKHYIQVSNGFKVNSKNPRPPNRSLQPIPFNLSPDMAKTNPDPHKLARITKLLEKFEYDPAEDSDEDIDDEIPQGITAANQDKFLEILKARAARDKSAKQTAALAKAIGQAMQSTPRKEKRVPKFAGKPDEAPAAHLLLVEDAFRAREVTDEEGKKDVFLESLEGDARLWYDDLKKESMVWEEIKTEFYRKFAKQGKHDWHIKRELLQAKFDPRTDDIHKYIRDVKATASMIGMNEKEQVEVIRWALPPDLYKHTSGVTDLQNLSSLLTDFISHDSTAPPRQTQNPTASPFMLAEGSTPQMVILTSDAAKTKKDKPFKPRIQQNQKGKKGRPQQNHDDQGNNQSRAKSPSNNPRFWDTQDQQQDGRGQNNWNQGRQDQRDDRQNYRGNNNNNNFGNRQGQRGFRSRQNGDRGQFQQRGNRRFQPRGRYISANPRNRNSPPKPRFRDIDQGVDRDRCKKCLEPGHWARDCHVMPPHQWHPRSPWNPRPELARRRLGTGMPLADRMRRYMGMVPAVPNYAYTEPTMTVSGQQNDPSPPRDESQAQSVTQETPVPPPFPYDMQEMFQILAESEYLSEN